MILFHGSNVEVCTPDTIHSRSNLDFGRGFYTTSIRSQAEKWCERFKKKYGVSFISKYELDKVVFSDCSVLKFDTYSAERLDFIVECRRGNDTDIPKETALERLRFEQPNIQYCFKDQNTIDKYLKYIGSEKI